MDDNDLSERLDGSQHMYLSQDFEPKRPPRFTGDYYSKQGSGVQL